MSEGDSIPSSDNNTSTANNTIDPANTAPSLTKESDHPEINTHGFFIPLVVIIVLGVSIVATFYSKEFNNLITAEALTDPGYELNSDAKGTLLAGSGSPDASVDVSASNITTESAVVADGSNEDAASRSESAVSATTSPMAGPPSTVTVAVDSFSSQPYKGASQDNQTAFSARQEDYVHPSAAPLPYAMPERFRQDYNEMMEQRRRAHEQSMQARREHMIKMHEYRAAVLKRIEQDRQYMYKRMQVIEQENQKRLEKLMNRMERVEKRSMNRAI